MMRIHAWLLISYHRGVYIFWETTLNMCFRMGFTSIVRGDADFRFLSVPSPGIEEALCHYYGPFSKSCV
jgi:hypothetical protein